MKRTLTMVAGLVAAAGLALPAVAGGQHGEPGQMQGQQDMMQMMPGQMPGGMMADQMMPAGMMQMMMAMHGNMMTHMQGQAMTGGPWPWALDGDADGQLSPEEITAGMTARMQEHDGNGDGKLSIAEFEALHAGMIRETMVDRFQLLDANGDGAVTAGEIETGAEEILRQTTHGAMHGPAGMMAHPMHGMLQNK